MLDYAHHLISWFKTILSEGSVVPALLVVGTVAGAALVRAVSSLRRPRRLQSQSPFRPSEEPDLQKIERELENLKLDAGETALQGIGEGNQSQLRRERNIRVDLARLEMARRRFDRPVLAFAKPPADAVTAVGVFFGTDRDPDKKGGYSGRRGGQLRLGHALVTAPRKRRPGSIARPLSVVGIRLEREDAAKHFVVQETQELEVDAFRTKLDSETRAAGRYPAMLFVHGYNATFNGGLYRAAQLAIDLRIRGPVLHYSWPSRGRPIAYDPDDATIKQARRHFREFLDVLASTSLTHVNIIAHSKGSELLLEALDDQPKSKLKSVGQIVLASPDVDSEFAEDAIGRIRHKVKGITLYACSADLALLASKTKAGGEPRAGGLLGDGYPLIVDGLDSIDASRCKLRLREFNHNAVVADTVLRFDLDRLLATGKRPPNERTPSITARTCPRGDYWYLEPR